MGSPVRAVRAEMQMGIEPVRAGNGSARNPREPYGAFAEKQEINPRKRKALPGAKRSSTNE
jgi:hypothetical protein